jgi:hypothetical protein
VRRSDSLPCRLTNAHLQGNNIGLVIALGPCRSDLGQVCIIKRRREDLGFAAGLSAESSSLGLMFAGVTRQVWAGVTLQVRSGG